MRINLRKATRLRKEIETALTDFQVPTEVRLDVDAIGAAVQAGGGTLDAAVETARNELEARVELHSSLSSALAELRKAINAANASSGVDAALAEGAAIDREMRIQQKVAGASRAEPTAVLQVRADRLKASLKAPETGYSRSAGSPILVAQLVSEERAAAAAKRVLELKRKRETVEDRRLALNAGTEIEIGEDDEAVLRVAGLI